MLGKGFASRAMISGNHQKCCQGYTLIELMIAAALSIFVVSILNSTLVKTAKFMEEMKYDMAGSAVVVGLLKSLALRKAKVNAIGVW